ncbi:MAG: tetratricopeptide repeat protein [bacterium]
MTGADGMSSKLSAVVLLAALALALGCARPAGVRASEARAEGAADADAGTQAAFRQACDLYDAGQFDAAASAFEVLRGRAARSADLLFNLGNCYYRQGRLGRAIASYRRALALAPGDGDARVNLDLVRAAAAGGDSAVVGLSRGPGLPLGPVSPRQLKALFYVACYLASGFLVVALIVGGRLRRPALYGLGVAVVVAVAAFALSQHAVTKMNAGFEGVIVVDRSEFKSGPGAAFEEISALTDGTELRLRAQSGMWVEAQLPTGEIGWVKEKDIERL